MILMGALHVSETRLDELLYRGGREVLIGPERAVQGIIQWGCPFWGGSSIEGHFSGRIYVHRKPTEMDGH